MCLEPVQKDLKESHSSTVLGVVPSLSSPSSFSNICKKKRQKSGGKVFEKTWCDRVTVHCGKRVSSSQRPLAVFQNASLPLVIRFHLCLCFFFLVRFWLQWTKKIKNEDLKSFHSERRLLGWPWKLWFIQSGGVSFTGGTLIDRSGQEQEEEVPLSIYGRNAATVSTETHAGIYKGEPGFFGWMLKTAINKQK